MKRPVLISTVLAVLLQAPALAHEAGISQLRFEIEGQQLHGEWEIHYDDALTLLGVPAQLDDDAAWQTLLAHEDSLRRAVTERVAVSDLGLACPLEVSSEPLRRNVEQGTAILLLRATCSAEPTELELSYEILFDVDARHRGYFSVKDSRMTHLGVFKEQERSVRFGVHRFRWWGTIAEFTWEGIWHIWTGLDHVLFLLALLLPASLLRTGDSWEARPGFWPTTRQVLKVVTAFTLAHSLTLVLAYLRVIVLPSRIVESAIALSVFLAAWNNLRPFLPGRTWVLAAAFGLVHGMGFAGALLGLALPYQARGLALATFNVGVEIGQVAIVAVVLPLFFLASRRSFYPRWIMGVGSLLIAWIAVLWTLERALGMQFMP